MLEKNILFILEKTKTNYHDKKYFRNVIINFINDTICFYK
jgi:hypothetical protein